VEAIVEMSESLYANFSKLTAAGYIKPIGKLYLQNLVRVLG